MQHGVFMLMYYRVVRMKCTWFIIEVWLESLKLSTFMVMFIFAIQFLQMCNQVFKTFLQLRKKVSNYESFYYQIL